MATTTTPERPSVSAKNELMLAITGDAHLRDSQYARASRGRDFYDAKLRTIEAATGAGIKVMLDTGDIFNVSRPSAGVIRQIIQLDRRLKRLGMVMLAVTGNHDWSTPTWLQTLFPDAEPEEFGIIPMDDRRVTVGGFVFQGIRPYTPSGYRENEKEIKAQCQGADVVLMHATVNGIVECGVQPDRMLDYSELPFVEGVKLIALGDLHYFGFITHRGVLLGYPGSTEMGSASEPTAKVLPLVKLTAKEALIAEVVPLTIRPFFSPTVKTEADVDALIAQLQPCKDKHPVLIGKFSREVPAAISRTFAMLDPQRAVIRWQALPAKEETPAERARVEEIDAHGIEYFLHARFGAPDRKNEISLSLDLLARGEQDAANILTDYIERRQQELAVREDTPTDS